MSRTRRNFSAKFKASLVLEVLKGEKDINTIATENDIQPNLLRNWKKEFLNNSSVGARLLDINHANRYYKVNTDI